MAIPALIDIVSGGEMLGFATLTANLGTHQKFTDHCADHSLAVGAVASIWPRTSGIGGPP
jgi:hypothetical protein